MRFKKRRATLTSAQIKTLYSAPVDLVAAPGPGKVIVPVNGGWAVMRAGATPYTLDGSSNAIWLAPSAATKPDLSVYVSQTLLSAAVDRIAGFEVSSYLPSDLSALEDQPLQLFADGGNPSLGDGSLDVFYYYATLEFA